MVFIEFWPQIVLNFPIFQSQFGCSVHFVDVTKASVQVAPCKTDLVLPQKNKDGRIGSNIAVKAHRAGLRLVGT